MASTASYHVDFQPIGRRGKAPADLSLLEIAHQLGVEIVSICGGEASCGQCKIQVLEGAVTPANTVEQQELSERELAAGYRLACQTHPLSDLKIHVPPESLSAPQRAQIEGLEVAVAPNPPVRAFQVQLTPPSLADFTADVERVREALLAQHGVRCDFCDVEVQRELSPELREWSWQVQIALRDTEIVGVGRYPTRQLGLAFDLGTTKIAGYLVDMATGSTVAARGTMNPQISYGEDLVTRLTRTRGAPAEARRMQAIAVEALNALAQEMCAEVSADPREIVEAVAVANTAMHHLLLRLPTEQLLMAPYIPAVRGALNVKARDVGLSIAPGAYLHVLPNIAGYVGADHVAMILATGIWKVEGLVLALDIGTNTEICLSDGREMSSLSAASGPAFEGAHIKYGMRAAPGAIEHIQLVGDRLDYQTIGGDPPVGICGSGILDAVAEFYRAGVLNRGGRMGEHPRVRENANGREFLLAESQDSTEDAREIVLTQKDVREVQLAKGAIRAGVEVLLRAMGRTAGEIEQVIIAGAFGSYVDPASTAAIGMLPNLPIERFRQVGNAAGTGARLALISTEQRAQAEEIARRVHYVELASVPDFARIFSNAIYLG